MLKHGSSLRIAIVVDTPIISQLSNADFIIELEITSLEIFLFKGFDL